jgi:hypothetical protein
VRTFATLLLKCNFFLFATASSFVLRALVYELFVPSFKLLVYPLAAMAGGSSLQATVSGANFAAPAVLRESVFVHAHLHYFNSLNLKNESVAVLQDRRQTARARSLNIAGWNLVKRDETLTLTAPAPVLRRAL